VKIVARVIGMGVEVEHDTLDPEEGEAYVLLKMKVEDARELAPGMAHPIGIEVVLSEAPREKD